VTEESYTPTDAQWAQLADEGDKAEHKAIEYYGSPWANAHDYADDPASPVSWKDGASPKIWVAFEHDGQRWEQLHDRISSLEIEPFDGTEEQWEAIRSDGRAQRATQAPANRPTDALPRPHGPRSPS
jgi:hypothetical protein